MGEPIRFERDGMHCTLLVDRECRADGKLHPLDDYGVARATEDDLRAAGFVRVPSVEELVDTINLAEEAWCDSPEEAMDCGPYVARAILRALGVQS